MATFFFFFWPAVYTHTHYCLKTLVIDNSGRVDQRDLPVRFDSKLIPSSYSIPECNELYHTYDVIGCTCVINQCRWIPKWCKLWIYCTTENLPLSPGSVSESLWADPAAVGQCKRNSFHWGVLWRPAIMLPVNPSTFKSSIVWFWLEKPICC